MLFLIAYHCFSQEFRLNGHDLSFYPLSRSTAFDVFESMNICVGMFAFLSSYGLTKTIKYKSPTLDMNAKGSTQFVTKRLISLLGSFFIPYVLCTASTFIFLPERVPYGKGVEKIFNLAADMFGLGGFLGTPMMIGTWWYMSFAALIILLMPVSVDMYKRYGLVSAVPYAVLPILFSTKFNSAEHLTNMTRWLLTIPAGIIFADCDLLVKLKSRKTMKNKYVGKVLKLFILTALLLFLLWLRRNDYVEKRFYYFISSIVPIFMVYYIYEYVTDMPVLNAVLEFFGKHSSNIFYMHTFIRGVWFPDFTYSLGHAAVTFLFMAAGSLVLSFAVEGLKKLIKWDAAVKRFIEFVLKRQQKLFFENNAVS